MKLLPMHKIQKQLKVGNNFMASLKKAGCPFPGNRGTIEWCMEWLKSHPEFKVSDFKSCKKESLQRRLPRGRRRHLSADRLDELIHLNGQQNSLLQTSEFLPEQVELSQ